MTRAIIVGHGPSMLAEEMGAEIDKFDYVIRMKRCHETLKQPEHYGTKTTHIGASLGIMGGVIDIPVENEYWGFMDSRHYNNMETLDSVKRLMHNRELPFHVDPPLCKMWDEAFMMQRKHPVVYDKMKPSVHGDDLGEKHTSQGFKAIVYAATRLDIDELVLIGFDNLYSGEFTWSVTRGPDWKQYPIHDWAVEHQMIPMVENTYNLKIGWMMPGSPEVENDGTEAVPVREDTN